MDPLSFDFSRRNSVKAGTSRRVDMRVYLNKIVRPVVFLAPVSSPLSRPWSGLLRVLEFLCVLRVKAFDVVYRRQNLNTEYTEKYENTERELD
jgi:hypothetical protein